MDLLERYQRGQHAQVWHELGSLKMAELTPEIEAEAWAVARETMRRARHNVELLYERLNEIGFEFLAPQQPENQREMTRFGEIVYTYQVFTPPLAGDTQRYLAIAETVFGRMPFSLVAWYELVGSVSWMGDHPRLCGYRLGIPDVGGADWVVADPLCVYPLSYALIEYDSFALRANRRPTDRFVFPLSPDARLKHRLEGDDYEGVVVPAETVDPLFTLTGKPFVEYLRLSFSWGGFPGWRNYPASARPRKQLEYLSSGLLPL